MHHAINMHDSRYNGVGDGSVKRTHVTVELECDPDIAAILEYEHHHRH